MKRKRRILTILFLAAAALLTGAVSAYMTAAQEQPNAVSIGSVTTTIKEVFPDPGKPDPGDVITKKVSLQSTGPDDCYARVQVLVSDSRAGSYCTIDWNTQDWQYVLDPDAPAAQWADDDWYADSSGWWYYKKILKPGETTPDLMNSVTISRSAEEIPEFDILVRQESRQSYGYGSCTEPWTSD